MRTARGSAYELQPKARTVKNLSDGFNSDVVGIRLTKNALRRGGDFFDESGWAVNNVSTESQELLDGPHSGAGVPGFRLCFDRLGSLAPPRPKEEE